MEFRWVAIITLWTMLSGPVFAAVSDYEQASRADTHKVRPSQVTVTHARPTTALR